MEHLHAHIKSSAGRINHSILDEAATLAEQLGGGALVFCKSGKDRTAMHLTYKQAQFAAWYRGQSDLFVVLEDAALIRTYGTRLPICEKNVGQAKYALNALQAQFMPDTLKPPMNTLSGFLRGKGLFGKGVLETQGYSAFPRHFWRIFCFCPCSVEKTKDGDIEWEDDDT